MVALSSPARASVLDLLIQETTNRDDLLLVDWPPRADNDAVAEMFNQITPKSVFFVCRRRRDVYIYIYICISRLQQALAFLIVPYIPFVGVVAVPYIVWNVGGVCIVCGTFEPLIDGLCGTRSSLAQSRNNCDRALYRCTYISIR